jgi:hypothetical protein
MAQNTSPIFVGVPNFGIGTNITSANTAMDGTGTVVGVFTAGANGGYVRRLRAKALGTNVATVLRIFINNGSTNATATNNVLFGELTLAASTASNSASVAADYEYPMNLVLPAGYIVNVCIGTAVSAGWIVSGEGGNY